MGCNCNQKNSLEQYELLPGFELESEFEFEDEFELIPEFERSTSSCPPAKAAAPAEYQKIQNRISNGERNENVLSDMIFFDRHPELNRKPLYKGQQCFSELSQEWLAIRDEIVRPSLNNMSSNPISSANQNCLTLDQFKFGKYLLQPLHYKIINGLVGKLIASQQSSNPIHEILITGYTDPKGSERFNITLGQKRGEAVSNAIKAKIKKENPGLLPRITIRVQSKGESEPVSNTNNSKNRRVVVCMEMKKGNSASSRAKTTKIVAKSFIMHIGNKIGDLNSTLRCQVASGIGGNIPIIGPIIGASPNTKLSVLAARTDQMFDGGENPQDDVKDKGYRLYSSISFTVEHDGSSIISVSSAAPITDVGIEPVADEIGIAFTPPEMIPYSRPKLTRVNSNYYTFQWGFKGRPPVIAEPGFQAICPRTSVYIWHEIYGGITIKDGAVKTVARILGSEFPSHRVWVDGETNHAMFKAQGPFSNLWVSSERDLTLVKEYEFA